jgi:hypothetical protein
MFLILKRQATLKHLLTQIKYCLSTIALNLFFKNMKHLLTTLFLTFALQFSYGQELIHYWNFNNGPDVADMLAVSSSKTGVAQITHVTGGISVIQIGTGQDFDKNNYNARNGDPAGSHLRFNDPIGAALDFDIPTTDYTNITVSFSSRRSGSGAGTQYWHYSVDGSQFVLFDSVFPSAAEPELYTLRMTGIAGVDNNPSLKLRVTFEQGAGGGVGNNRFDNFTVEGTPTTTLLHYWNFNDVSSLSALLTPNVSISGTASIQHITGGSSAINVTGGTANGFSDQNLNARLGDASGTHLRFDNPIGGALQFHLPTTNYSNIVVQFTTRRSGSGAGTQYWHYSTDGTQFILFDSIFPSSVAPELKTLSFGSIAGANDNPNFHLRVTFAQGAGGDVGNNRFDNFSVESLAEDLSGRVSGVRVSSRELFLLTGTDTLISATITPEDATDKSVVWSSSDATVATVNQSGLITAVSDGTAFVFVTTNDGGFFDSCKVIVTTPSDKDLIYYWHFNDFFPSEDVTEIAADYSLILDANPKFTYTLTPDASIINDRDIDRFSPGTLLNAQLGQGVGGAARVRNPSINRSLIFDVPTTGVKDLLLSLAVQRSNNGSLTNTIAYALDGVTFVSDGLDNHVQEVKDFEVWQMHTYDFSGIEAINNNPLLKIRITWEDANAGNPSGNNRYDNIAFLGTNVNASVTPVSHHNNVSVYPNPAQQELKVFSSHGFAPSNVALMDLSGRVVLESKESVLTIGHLPNGVYFVITTIQGVTYRNKVMIQH